MNPLDIVILVLVAFGAYKGYRKGLMMAIIGLLSFFISVILSLEFLPLASAYLSDWMPSRNTIIPVIGFVILFVGFVILLNGIGKALKKVLNLTFLGTLDDFIGGVMGALKWILLLSVIAWAYETFVEPVPESLVKDSIALPMIKGFIPFLISTFSFLFPYFEEFQNEIKDLLEEKEYFT